MTELNGIECYKDDTYCLFYIYTFTDEVKEELRAQFATICHGVDCVNSGRELYSYRNTVQEFLKRYEQKPDRIKIGMIGELLTHLLIGEFFDEYKVVTPFFNMEERSVKKGYDVVLTETNNPTIWLTEIKSGELHKNKNASQTMTDLLNKAKTDLETRLNEENATLWHEAINGARLSFDSKNTMKEAVIDVLSSWGEEAYRGNNTSKDKNVILSGVVFSDFSDVVDRDIPRKKQEGVEHESTFKKVYVIALQKETYDKVHQFLREEARNEEE